MRVVTQTTGVATQAPERVLSGAEILEIQQLVRQVIVAEEIARYAVRLVDASRPGRQGAHGFVTDWVKWGAGLRASQALILAGKARALIHGRYHVSVERHTGAGAAGVAPSGDPEFLRRVRTRHARHDHRQLLEAVPVPQSGM